MMMAEMIEKYEHLIKTKTFKHLQADSQMTTPQDIRKEIIEDGKQCEQVKDKLTMLCGMIEA